MKISAQQLEIIRSWITDQGLTLISVTEYHVEFKFSLFGTWYCEIEVDEDSLFLLSVLREDERHVPIDLSPFNLSKAVSTADDLHQFLAETEALLPPYKAKDQDSVITLVNTHDTIYQLYAGETALSLATFFVYARFDAFLSRYVDLIEGLGIQEFFWEHPKCEAGLMGYYEVSIVPSSHLERITPNPKPFARYYTDAPFVTFKNLRKDAILMVPTPQGDRDFASLARFIRNGERGLVVDFFRFVFETWRGCVLAGAGYRYLSTHGLGVHWVHVRIDLQPKYYRTKVYC